MIVYLISGIILLAIAAVCWIVISPCASCHYDDCECFDARSKTQKAAELFAAKQKTWKPIVHIARADEHEKIPNTIVKDSWIIDPTEAESGP